VAEVEVIRRRLAAEHGTLTGHGRRALALVYPSPYAAGMSSLGFQQVYRLLNGLPDTVAERAFLKEGREAGPLLTYESLRPAANFPVIGFSVAYELELSGMFACLKAAGIPTLAADRSDQHPTVVVGGPLTASNAAPLAPFADVIVIGEAEQLLVPLVDGLFSGLPRREALRALATLALPGLYVPSEHGVSLPAAACCGDQELPACAAIVTPHAALSDMFLVEAERGCARKCSFCAMRRGAGRGMRLAAASRVLAAIPPFARKVGLVGAAVSDHPEIISLIRRLVDEGREVSLSSLRADRLSPELVELLVRGGLRTLTIAADGASQRLRDDLGKGLRTEHLLEAARLASDFALPQLKNYVMLGVPGEGDEDVDELAACTLEQVRLAAPSRVVLGVATFVPKRSTPLAEAPFAGIGVVNERLSRLRSALRGKAELRAVSSRWAWAEFMLAQGGPEAGLAAWRAFEAGNQFGAWRRAFAEEPLSGG
jgi:radical SAM superfamily enzyme YgiQ (UPF0313 family)